MPDVCLCLCVRLFVVVLVTRWSREIIGKKERERNQVQAGRDCRGASQSDRRKKREGKGNRDSDGVLVSPLASPRPPASRGGGPMR